MWCLGEEITEGDKFNWRKRGRKRSTNVLRSTFFEEKSNSLCSGHVHSRRQKKDKEGRRARGATVLAHNLKRKRWQNKTKAKRKILEARIFWRAFSLPFSAPKPFYSATFPGVFLSWNVKLLNHDLMLEILAGGRGGGTGLVFQGR